MPPKPLRGPLKYSRYCPVSSTHCSVLPGILRFPASRVHFRNFFLTDYLSFYPSMLILSNPYILLHILGQYTQCQIWFPCATVQFLALLSSFLVILYSFLELLSSFLVLLSSFLKLLSSNQYAPTGKSARNLDISAKKLDSSARRLDSSARKMDCSAMKLESSLRKEKSIWVQGYGRRLKSEDFRGP